MFEQAGAEVVVTARDDGGTYRLLQSEGIGFHAVGRQPGRSRRRKVTGVLRRAHALAGVVGGPRPDLVLSASRPASLTARYLGFPAFFISDYEFTSMTVQRAMRSYVLFPDVIDPEGWRMRPDRLIPFRGLKEDLSFSGIALDDYPPHRFTGASDAVPRLLFRPPAVESHYHREESTVLAGALLGYLAAQATVQVVYLPRYEYQTAELERHEWQRPPLVLREPVHFVSLLKGVDLVISSGGTMLREAAYLGVPAYSIFQSRIGAVDRYLESIGRLHFVRSAADFGAIELTAGYRLPTLRQNPELANQLLAEIKARLPRAGGSRAGRR